MNAVSGSAINGEVEFGVASTTIEQKVLLAFSPLEILATLQNGLVCGQNVVANRADEVEALLETAFIPVVEEQTADASGLLPVRQVGVLVTLLLQPWVDVLAERVAGFLRGPVPVYDVLEKRVVRREIEAAPEIPRGLIDDEKAKICMERRHIGVSRMHDHRDRGRLETLAGQFGIALAGSGRQPVANAVRELHGAAFYDVAVEHTRARVRAIVLANVFDAEAAATVDGAERVADPGLQIEKVLPDGFDIRSVVHGRHDTKIGRRLHRQGVKVDFAFLANRRLPLTDVTIQASTLEPIMASLAEANAAFGARYPGVQLARQPVHTVYGGAQLYGEGAAEKLGKLSRAHFDAYASPETLANLFGMAPAQAITIYERVRQKLATEPVEDHRVDFEDGYGSRPDDEEDGHALAAATAMATTPVLPMGVGIRIKALTEEAKVRALRTLDLFLTRLVQTRGELPAGFAVTLPKVTSPAQVAALADALDLLESALGLDRCSVRIEIMIETIQSILAADGRAGIPPLVAAGRGRVTLAVLGTFDYTASCNIASTWQDHDHPAADFARNMMQVSLTGTEVALCDGITNVMPIGPHRGNDLTAAQQEENRAVVHAAWKAHFDNIQHSLRLGFYQGWDLNPAQIPVRFMAVYDFFLDGLADATERLRTFVDRAAQASLVGNTFDDAATGQGLVNFFVSGLNCGALDEADVEATGLSLQELRGRSFLKIVENRMKELT